MAINFPSAPVVGQVYQAEDVDFVWNGTLWVVLAPSNATFASKAEAEAGARDDVFLSPLRADEAIAALRQTPDYDLPAAICRAWVRFNGETSTIIASFNVASLVNDGGVGRTRVTFQNPMPDANYIILPMTRGITNHNPTQMGLSTAVQNDPAFCRLITGTTGGGNRAGFNANSALCHVSFWR
jgi:hypothetical protein